MGHIDKSNNGSVSLSPSSIGGATTLRKRIQMETMTNEELKLNKQIIQEISARKKDRLERIAPGTSEMVSYQY